MRLADFVFAYVAGAWLFMMAVSIAARRRVGWSAWGAWRPPIVQEVRLLAVFVPFIVAWPIGLMRWSWLVDRVTALMKHPPRDPSEVEHEFTEEEYRAAERISDQTVGLWLLTIVAAAAGGAALSALTGLDAGVAGVIVMVPSVVLFLRWSSKRTKGLPRQRQVVRPVRVRWLLKTFALTLGVLLLALVAVTGVIALMNALA